VEHITIRMGSITVAVEIWRKMHEKKENFKLNNKYNTVSIK
jgi:hypothetical protein